MNEAKLHLYRKFGSQLEDKSVWFKKHAFNVKSKEVYWKAIRSVLTGKYGIPKDKIYFADGKYWVSDIDTIKLINKYDWINRRKYLVDRFDCDNFADLYRARMAYIFGINTCGSAKGIKLTNENGELIAYHRANLIVATQNNTIKAFFFEPQTDEIKEVDYYNKPIKLSRWNNHLGWFEFN